MPRFRALFLLGLFLVNQAACTSWQVPKVTPQEYVAQHPDTKVLVTLKNDHGSQDTQAGVVLAGVRFSGDSILGHGPEGQPLAYRLQQLGAIKVSRVNGLLTAWLVLAVASIAALGAVLLSTIQSPP